MAVADDCPVPAVCSQGTCAFPATASLQPPPPDQASAWAPAPAPIMAPALAPTMAPAPAPATASLQPLAPTSLPTPPEDYNTNSGGPCNDASKADTGLTFSSPSRGRHVTGYGLLHLHCAKCVDNIRNTAVVCSVQACMLGAVTKSGALHMSCHGQ